MYYMSEDNMSNGRLDIYLMACETAGENLLLGNGIGYFELVSGGSYCHNIFIQAINEGGLLFFIPIIYYSAIIIYNVFFYLIKNEYSLITYKWYVFALCCGIEVLLFSSSYWTYPLFWFLLGSFLRQVVYKNINCP